MIPRILATASLLLVSAAVFLPFSRAHFAWRDLADAYIHLVRIFVVDAALGSGDLYPRWLSDLYLGYGYPLLNYYAPATYYAGALFHRLGATIYGSLQLLGALAVLLGASGASALGRSVGAPRAAAVLAGGAYALAPYPFLTNLYIRAALPEALALGLLPWVLTAAQHALGARTRGSTLRLAAVVALICLTHNVTALIALALIALLATAQLVRARSIVSPIVSGTVLGLLLSAFFWLPALLESRYVQLDLLGGGIYDYRTWLFRPEDGLAQLSAAYDYSALDRAVPAKLSLAQAGLLALSTTTLLIQRRLLTAWPWLVTAIACVFLTTTWADLLWRHVPGLPLMQFPWRLHGPTALGTALLASLALRGIGRRVQVVLVASALALLSFSSLPSRPLLLAPDPPHDVNASLLASEEYNKYGAGTTSGGEFLPRTAQWGSGPRDQRRGIRVYDESFPQVSWQGGLARVLSGRAAITAMWRTPHAISLDVDAADVAVLAVHQLAFPGWRAFLDGAPTSLGIMPPDLVRGVSLGFMTLSIPPGTHQIELRFGSTPIRTAAGAVSGAALGLLLALLLSSRRPALDSFRFQLAASLACAAIALAGAELPGRLPTRRGDVAVRATGDVTSAAIAGGVQVTSPLGSATALMPPYVESRYLTIEGDTRRWLFVHPPSEIAVPVTIPDSAYLQTALAIDPAAWQQPVGDGVRFIAELELDGTRIVVLDQALDPRARSDHRRWLDVWADLRAYGGRTGRLILRTDSRAEPSYDWAGWAHPQIVAWRSSRPVPSDPHPW